MLSPRPDAPLIPARNLRQWLTALEHHCSIDPRTLLAGSGINPASLSSPDTRISPRQEIVVLRRARSFGVDTDFGMQVAADFQIGDYGLLGYAMLSSATLGDGIDIALRYYKTAGSMLELSWAEADGVGVLSAHDLYGAGDALRWVLDSLFGGLPALLRTMVGIPVPVRSVELAGEAPSNVDRYTEVYGVVPTFNCPVSRFSVDSSWLERPLVGADANNALFFERSCRELLQALEGEQTIESRLRRMLLDRGGQYTDSDAAAAHLNIGPRTLRRHLRARGTAWREILDDVRRRIASDYLEFTDLPIQRIGELLGYSEATNFRRAFVKWTGHSPHEHRLAHLPSRPTGRDATQPTDV